MQKKIFFTKEESERKVGMELIAKKSFLDIYAGTEGLVSETMLTVSGYCVMILWKGAEVPIVLTKDEYEDLVKEKISVVLCYDRKSGFKPSV